jgi:hypothetical protein
MVSVDGLSNDSSEYLRQCVWTECNGSRTGAGVPVLVLDRRTTTNKQESPKAKSTIRAQDTIYKQASIGAKMCLPHAKVWGEDSRGKDQKIRSLPHMEMSHSAW